MTRRVDTQMRVILDKASRNSGSVPRGRPHQQVGDHYAAGLNVNRFTAIGVSLPALARLNLLLNDLPLAGAGGCTK
jgi:hypothetical protein